MGSLHKYEWLDGRYRLKEKIGKGSFGEVWLVYDNESNIDMAAKVYFALDAQGNNDLKQEFTNTHKLNHPNLLHPTFFGVSDDRSYIIMPYCPTTASKLIGCCNEMMAWKFVRDVANGLTYLHQHDIVHHDIKPDNILIGEDGFFKITDFGVSIQLRDLMNNEKEAIKGGTEGYMAPEMFMSGAESIKASDIWALGATVYEMLTGELPYHALGGRGQIAGTEQVEIPYHFISDNLVQLVRDCMAKEPWDRPQAQEIADYIRILFDESVEHPEWKAYFENIRREPIPEPEPEPDSGLELDPEPIGRKRRLWWVPVAAAVVAGIIVVLWSARPQSTTEEQMKMGLLDSNTPVDTLTTDTVAKPILAEATYLTVNGSEKPKQLKAESKKTRKTISVSTDGPSFTIELPKDCTWLSVEDATDSNFVLLISPNETIEKRSNKIKVIAGDLIKEVPIYQEPDPAKVARSKLKPANDGLNSNSRQTSARETSTQE